MKTKIHFFIISRSVLLRMRSVSDKSFRENQNTYFVFSIFFFDKCVLYEIMLKNIVESERLEMAIWRMCIARCITNATGAHSE